MIDTILLALWYYFPCKRINTLALNKYLKRNYLDLYNEIKEEKKC